MAISDRLRSVLYPLIFFGMIAILWFVAWSDAYAAEATSEQRRPVHIPSMPFDQSGMTAFNHASD